VRAAGARSPMKYEGALRREEPAEASAAEALRYTPEPPGRQAWTARASLAVGEGQRAKRVLDVVVAAALLVSLAPIFVVVAVLIALIDGRPVVFWQQRVGIRGRLFWFPKFRSMRNGAEHEQDKLRPHANWPAGVTFKMWDDPRVTALGRILRVSSIDELPQLWCVLNGDMSMVGPRPPLPDEVAQYNAIERRRLEAKPGLTCLWQVSGRSTLPFREQVALDLWYIENQSLWLDLTVLLRTIWAVLSCRGAF